MSACCSGYVDHALQTVADDCLFVRVLPSAIAFLLASSSKCLRKMFGEIIKIDTPLTCASLCTRIFNIAQTPGRFNINCHNLKDFKNNIRCERESRRGLLLFTEGGRRFKLDGLLERKYIRLLHSAN